MVYSCNEIQRNKERMKLDQLDVWQAQMMR